MDYENIKKLITDMGNSNLSSLQIDFPDGTKINMIKESDNTKLSSTEKSAENKSTTVCVSNDSNTVISEKQTEENENYRYIKSPMVGTFYSKPAPNEKEFIQVGDEIKKGTTTCIIEAMKLMNEIEAEFDGKVVEILKQDGEPVEYGENLIKIL